MINPYQAPQEEEPNKRGAASELASHLSAEFQLGARQIRRAENRFLLYRCSIRLTIASLLMIGLSIYVAGYVGEQFGVLSAFNWISPRLVFAMFGSQLIVMLLAATVYQSLVWGVRKRIRKQLQSLGVIADATIEVTLLPDRLRWKSPTGEHVFQLNEIAFRQSSVGLIGIVGRDQFLLIPRRDDFRGGGPCSVLAKQLLGSSETTANAQF